LQIVNNSIKFKFIRKISVFQEKFPVLFNLLRGLDKTYSGGRIQLAGCASLLYRITTESTVQLSGFE